VPLLGKKGKREKNILQNQDRSGFSREKETTNLVHKNNRARETERQTHKILPQLEQLDSRGQISDKSVRQEDQLLKGGFL